MITIKSFVFNSFQENTYVLSNAANDCIIIDPGISSKSEEKECIDYITNNGLNPKAIYNTHCHVDHVLGCQRIINIYNIPFYAHESEKILIEEAPTFAEFFGIRIDQPPFPDSTISENDTIIFGESELIIYHIPGHSPGSLVFYNKENHLLITGDVLFRGSIGRTDLPGGNYNQLVQGIKTKLLTLPRETIVYPGHGPTSTIGNEYDTNPFLL